MERKAAVGAGSEPDAADPPSADGRRVPGSARNDVRPISTARIAFGAAAILVLAGLYWGLSHAGLLPAIGDEQALRGQIDRLGLWGPLAIVALMIAAIVVSPIPSGPIAIVAGAAYGPLWGTVYIVIGAEAGALIAFWIARCLGYEAVRRWSAVRPLLNRLRRSRSQTWLMAAVFASRLVPFISFDAVSYAAGLTPLAFWRFAAATLAGVVPISFLLAYFGEALLATESWGARLAALLVGGITLLPLAARFLWTHYRTRDSASHSD